MRHEFFVVVEVVGEGGGGGGSRGRNGFGLVIGVCEGTVGTEELHIVGGEVESFEAIWQW